ncbi:hypothetical protein G647_01536 [Cladophialophora carrionii CBS 160.54]|uniref:Oxidoreductase n=1 Tax=Cladophialophora carrionii CBS 160.54 TaxID=1279043 RepID=V9DRZ4_9EURO|nr:uncharacterized protein G647_01536 [Cladophialophora carrionii CBS 160.54]ETI29083.1 hypothetical protein G647_01536 [Cladophialophora carrionii CBS 160.54]
MWPFSPSIDFVPDKDIADLTGKVILVTGGNTGIGKETVLQLAKHRPRKLFLAARTQSKAEEAIADIRSAIAPKTVDIEYLPLDLSSLASVKAAAERVKERDSRLDLLILNAGIMAVPPGKTNEDFEIQLGTNHVGHALLTKLLLPTLEKTAAEQNPDVRIVVVASNGYTFAPNIDTILSTEKLCETGPWTRYGASKAANILFAAELALRYPSLTSVSLHPGTIQTDLYLPNKRNSFVLRCFLSIFGPLLFQPPQFGALTQLYLASGAKKDQLKNGGFYTPVGVLDKNNKWANEKTGAKALWEWTEDQLKSKGY